MTLHFIHVGKTGGTAMKRALRLAGIASGERDEAPPVGTTPYGPVQLHHHRFRLTDLPAGDHVFFCVRDPIARFLSGFYSRLNKGQPRYYVEWTPAERRAFEAFGTPQQLAAALASDDDGERQLAQEAMRRVDHLGFMGRQLGTPRQLRARLGHIVYIATQETLGADWEHVRTLLGVPADVDLPSGAIPSHRGDRSRDTTLDDDALRTLRAWYARDYRLLRYCEQLRAWRGWGRGAPPEGIARLHHEAVRLQGIPAILPPPPPAVRRRLRFL